MENDILTLCAYHESGRVVFAYYAGFFCDGMELSSSDYGRGKSRLNAGSNIALVQQILSGNSNSPEPENRSHAIEIAQQLMNIYCAGTCSRLFFELDGNIGSDVELDVPAQDEKPIAAIQKFLSSIVSQHDENYAVKKMSSIFHKLKEPEVWKAISGLAAAAILSNEKPLTRFEIEDALMAGGLKVKRVASPGFSIGLGETPKDSVATTSTAQANDFKTEGTADILLKDFFRKIRKDWGDEEITAATQHVKEIIAKY